MIKHYFQLVRIPGIFTAFSNILVGFFLVQESYVNLEFIIPLLSTSGFLFLAGMIFNDYFDYELDKKERPSRPLPSGAISKKSAFFLGVIFLFIANISSSLVGVQSLMISFLMTLLILSYDFRLKQIPILGILSLSTIRFLNVILGASIILFDIQIIQYAIPIGLFVGGISILAKTETSFSSEKTKFINLILIFATLIYTLFIILKNFEIISLIFLSIFSISVFFPFFSRKNVDTNQIQKKVTFQLLAIIILDATLISTVSDISVALLTASLYIPSYLIIRKMYLS